MKRYTDFEIWIDAPAAPPSAGSPPVYPVQVTTSLAGSASGSLELDLANQGFQNELSVVRDMGPDLPGRQAFGHKLFEALFRNQVRDAWMTSRGRLAAGEADGLRLRLWINDPLVALLPWELMHEEGKGFLATAANLALSRYMPVPEPPAFTMREKLRVLVVVESPSNLTLIEDEEVDTLRDALTGLGSTLEHTILRNPAVPQIQAALQQDYHVLHFLGHGQAGKLALTEAGGTKASFIADQEFAQLVQGRPSLRLIVLNACYSSQAATGELFAGMGPSLVKMQMPAVVAMQYNTVFVDTAGKFSQAFYSALANGIPVDFAVNEARQQLSAGPLLEQRDWSTPVLYMGTRNGRILDMVSPQADEVERAWHTVTVAVQDTQIAHKALSELVERFGQIGDLQRSLADLLELEDDLRQVRAGFAVCLDIVKQAGALAGQRLERLQQAWTGVRQEKWSALQVFLDGHPVVKAAVYLSSLESCVQDIETNMRQLRLGQLPVSITDLGAKLDLALAAVHQEKWQTMNRLRTLSDATLGKLALE